MLLFQFFFFTIFQIVLFISESIYYIRFVPFSLQSIYYRSKHPYLWVYSYFGHSVYQSDAKINEIKKKQLFVTLTIFDHDLSKAVHKNKTEPKKIFRINITKQNKLKPHHQIELINKVTTSFYFYQKIRAGSQNRPVSFPSVGSEHLVLWQSQTS